MMTAPGMPYLERLYESVNFFFDSKTSAFLFFPGMKI